MEENKFLKEISARLEKLENAVFGSKNNSNNVIPGSKLDQSISFEVNERAFVNKHAKGMSGPKKFTLIVALKSKGNENSEISFDEIEKSWNRMKSLLGGPFNRFYPNMAKTKGWVDSKRKSFYNLTSTWKDIFK